MLIVNFKTYKQGKEVLKLIKEIEKYNKKAIVCLQPTDICLSQKTKLKVFSQHIDFQTKGKNTGFIVAETIISLGAAGSLLNHSEHPLNFETIKKTIKNSKKLKLIVCTSSIREVKKIKKLKPYAIAFEDPKLIATKKSITKHNPKKIKKFVQILKDTKIIPICGAGISNSKDYKKALELGCRGVLVSSAIANSKNPIKFLKSIK